MERKGVLLYSGGLDSLLAAKILIDQGISLTGIHFVLPFVPPDSDPAAGVPARFAADIGLPLVFHRLGRQYMEMVKNPPHGYGKQMNPCIDCKIHFLGKAREHMESEGAAFVATGEVVGQRPMSQMRHMLIHIEKKSGLRDHLLRPLSAKLLKPTAAEREGIVDRERLLGISGRSRSSQGELARKYRIQQYASPAGGCLFTDVFIARRVRDLFTFHPDFSMTDVYLLSIGRHLRFGEKAKAVIGRDEEENAELLKYSGEADYLLIPRFKGPSVFVRGEASEGDLALACSLVAYYGRREGAEGRCMLSRRGSPCEDLVCGESIGGDTLERMRI